MAYNLKYQSVHYSVHRIPIKVEIFKRDYVGSVSNIRVQSTTIETNNQGYATPVIGTNAKIQIVNTGAFTQYDDLLMSKEKEFRCKIWIYEDILVFDGFSICDMNEQQFLPKAVISLNFTNYLRRLEDKTFTLPTSGVGRYSNVADLFHKSLDYVGLGNQILLNSSLFEKTMDTGEWHTCLEQLFVDIDMFLNEDNSQDDIYTMLTKLLVSLDARLYAFQDKWIIERIPDIENPLDWYVISEWNIVSPVPNELTNPLVQYYNKQDGAFNYIDTQQTLQYVSGTHTLKLNIQDKRKSSLLHNDWDTVLAGYVISLEFTENSLLNAYQYQWYYTIYNASFYVTDIVNRKLSPYKGITSSIQWTAVAPAPPNEFHSYINNLYIGFGTSICPATTDGVNQDTSLTVAFKTYAITTLYSYKRRVRFFVYIRSGAYAGYFLTEQNGEIVLSLNRFRFVQEFTHETDNGVLVPWETLDISKEISVPSEVFSAGTGKIDIFIGVYPTYHEYQDGDDAIATNVMGDFRVTVNSDILKNEISYNVSDDFIKTTETDVHLCDVPDVSYANGLLVKTAVGPPNPYTKTSGWIDAKTADDVDNSEFWNASDITSDWPGLPSDWFLGEVARPLVDIIAANWHRRFNSTSRVLKSRITSQEYFKLFSIFTDDNLMENGAHIKFLLTNYVWDLENETWDVDLEEYHTEGVIINEA